MHKNKRFAPKNGNETRDLTNHGTVFCLLLSRRLGTSLFIIGEPVRRNGNT